MSLCLLSLVLFLVLCLVLARVGHGLDGPKTRNLWLVGSEDGMGLNRSDRLVGKTLLRRNTRRFRLEPCQFKDTGNS